MHSPLCNKAEASNSQEVQQAACLELEVMDKMVQKTLASKKRKRQGRAPATDEKRASKTCTMMFATGEPGAAPVSTLLGS